MWTGEKHFLRKAVIHICDDEIILRSNPDGGADKLVVVTEHGFSGIDVYIADLLIGEIIGGSAVLKKESPKRNHDKTNCTICKRQAEKIGQPNCI